MTIYKKTFLLLTALGTTAAMYTYVTWSSQPDLIPINTFVLDTKNQRALQECAVEENLDEVADQENIFIHCGIFI